MSLRFQAHDLGAHASVYAAGAQQPNLIFIFIWQYACEILSWAETPAFSTASMSHFEPIRESTSKAVHWDMSPVRRKHYKRKRPKHAPPPTTLIPIIQLLTVTTLTVHYFTATHRIAPVIIFMDSLLTARLLGLAAEFLSSYLKYLQESINKIQHTLNGNPRLLLLEPLLFENKQLISLEDCLPSTAQVDVPSYSISELLSHRPTNSSVEASPLLQTRPRLLLIKHRKGRRRQVRKNSDREKFFYKTRKRIASPQNRSRKLWRALTTPQGNMRDSLIHRIQRINYEATQPAPPPRGAPGAAFAANGECQPQPLKHSSPLGRGARVLRRRLYRQWRSSCGEHIRDLRLGKVGSIKGKPRNAASQRSGNSNAQYFRHLVLTQGLHRGPQRNKQVKLLATPQLEYGFCLKLGTQNVQGMAEILKHQQVLDMMTEKSVHVMLLTETRNKSYYTYNSQGFLWALNGNSKDRFGGVTAVVAPHIRPFIHDVVQHSSRIIQITLSLQSGKVHIIGVYAPHDKHDYSSIKLPFWQQLQEIVSSIPLPESVYVLGDFNVRLQGRKTGEYQIIGPHVFGKGHLYAKTGPERNRSLFTEFLFSTNCCDSITFRNSDMIRQITYREKFPPPKSWLQFSADPIPLLQFWDIISSLPVPLQDSLEIGQLIRSFITPDSLIDSVPTKPADDPSLFQSLDKVVCRKQWLPTIRQCYASHNTGFPSDHYLLLTHISVKLGSKPPRPPATIKYDYSATDEQRTQFNRLFREKYAGKPCIPLQTTPPQHIKFYTDGSGSSGRATRSTLAGWGYVGYYLDAPIVKAYGPVNVDQLSPFHLGANVGSNNTGELSAIMEVLLLLAHPDNTYTSATINYDSKWAASMVKGTARPKRNKQMVNLARLLLQRVRDKVQIEWKWVKGHTGDSGNEIADELADQGKTSLEGHGGRYEQEPPLLLRDIMAENASLDYSSTVNQKYKRFLDATKYAEAITFKPQQYAPRRPWISNDTLQKLRIAKHLKSQEDPQ